MTANTSSLYSQRTSVILIILSLICACYWLGVSSSANIYKIAVIGAIAEIMWLPMLAALIIIPIASIIILIKKKTLINSLSFYSLIIMISILLFMIFRE